MKITTAMMEVKIAQYFGVRRHLIVPNVSWGLGLHECDLLIVTKSGFANEIEIKVSKADLKKDGLKRHGHRSNRIRRLFFAIPEDIERHKDLIPDGAGIIIVGDRRVRLDRTAKINKYASPLTVEQRLHLGMLASMRIWGLKKRLVDGLKKK